MFRHLLSIVTIVWCACGVTGYSFIRIASLADAAQEAANRPADSTDPADKDRERG